MSAAQPPTGLADGTVAPGCQSCFLFPRGADRFFVCSFSFLSPFFKSECVRGNLGIGALEVGQMTARLEGRVIDNGKFVEEENSPR